MINDVFWVPVAGLALALLLFFGFFITMFIAGLIDLYHERKNRVWAELKRTDYERRRPAAK